MKLKTFLFFIFTLLIVFLFIQCPAQGSGGGGGSRGDEVGKSNEDNINPGTAIGWIGGGNDGWKTGNAPSSFGTDIKSFYTPEGICIDSSGNIYIAETNNNRISKWNSAGTAIGWIGGGNDGWQTGNNAPGYGTDYRSFKNPKGVCIDGSGYIYILDFSNNRISKWNSSGTAIGWIGGGSDGWKTGNAPGYGTDFRSFTNSEGMHVDVSGNIFVADTFNNRIVKWNSSGTAIGWIGGGNDGWQTGNAPASGLDYQSFTFPAGVCTDSSGNIYAADGNNRISKWSSSGEALGWIGEGSNIWKLYSASGSYGTNYQSFQNPLGVCVDVHGNIYVVDCGNKRISKWNSSGIAIGWIGGGNDGWQTGNAPFSYATDYRSFFSPTGVCLDNSGNIYIGDTKNNRVCKWKY